MAKFRKQQSLLFYKILNRGDQYSVMHCQDVMHSKYVDRQIIKGTDEYINFIEKNNNLGNIFISRNPVDKDGKVVAIQNLTFDLDPENYDKSLGSTQEQMAACERAGRAIVEAYPGSWLAFSGNGCLVGVPFSGGWMENLQDFPKKFKTFSEKYIKPIVAKTEGVKLDELWDNERLIKCVGTVSCRGEKRYTRFLQIPSGSVDSARLSSEFNGLEGAIPVDNIHKPEILPVRSAPKIGHPNRQRYLVSLAGSLHRRGLSEQFIFEAVKKAYLENCILEPLKSDEKLLNIVQSVMRYSNKEGLQGYGALYIEEEPTTSEEEDQGLTGYDLYLEAKGQFKEPELTTGFKNLDALCYGYQRGDVFTIGAYTGGGKSTFLVNSADALIKAGRRVLYLSTEMGKYQIYDKFFSLNTDTDYLVYLKGNFTSDELQRKAEYSTIFKQYLKDGLLKVNDSLKLTVESVRLLVGRFKPDVLIFDHIHEVGHGSQNYYGFLKDFTHGLQLLARDYNCAVVLAAQFARPMKIMDMATGQYKKPPRPTVNSVKACGDIENKSRVVALLYDTYESLNPDKHVMEMDVAKCTKGLKGQIRLNWIWKKSKFMEP